MGLGAAGGLGLYFLIGGIGIAVMGTGIGLGLGAFMVIGAIVGAICYLVGKD